MMAFDTIIQQGRFTADGNAKVLQIRSDFDWIEVFNETAAAQAAADLGYKFYWQKGMTNGAGFVHTILGTVANDPVTVGAIAASAGFTVIDTSGALLGSSVAITAGTNITEPVFTTGSTAGLVTGSIVRLSGMTGQTNLNGYDFAIDTVVTNTSFKMAAALATAPGAAATAGAYRIVNFEPEYYPPFRYITNITQAASAVVTVSVPSLYKVGQKIKFSVPDAKFGMVEMDGLEGTVTAVVDTVGTQTVTVDIDSTGFSAFTFPTGAQALAGGFSKAMVYPVGMNTAQALSSGVDVLGDAVYNTGYIGVRLAAGTASPAGQAADVISWRAGKSFSVDN